MPEYSASSKNTSIEIDAGIKALLAILLAAATAFCSTRLDLVYFALYLVLITLILRSNFRFILKNMLSYGIIIVFPYLFGLLISMFINKLLPGTNGFNNYNSEAALFKLVKIFFIWYIGSLYFFTTPFESIKKMLDKILSPLNSIGIPVEKYLNMIMFIVNELARSVSQFKQDIWEQARSVIKNHQLGIKKKSQEIARILADFIANSLQRTDEIQAQVDLASVNDAPYSLRMSKIEMASILSFIIFLILIIC